MHGFGTYTWPNGSSYIGEWAHDEHNGVGIYKCAGEFYEGEWTHNARHGKGTEHWNSGHSYNGSWENNKKHGKGMFTWPDRDYYVGVWKFGIRCGKGLLISNESVYLQVWPEEGVQPNPLTNNFNTGNNNTANGNQLLYEELEKGLEYNGIEIGTVEQIAATATPLPKHSIDSNETQIVLPSTHGTSNPLMETFLNLDLEKTLKRRWLEIEQGEKPAKKKKVSHKS